MATSYIPARETDLVTWADNFSTLITAAPATYGLTPTDATNISTVVNAWDSAYATAVNPSTRTPATIAAKNSARNAMIPVLRTYASQIRINPGVTNMAKVALGLNLPNNTPSPIPAPATQPVITITSAINLRQVCKFRDEAATPTSRAKAANSIGCEIWIGIDSVSLNDPAQCSYYGSAVKVPFYIDHDPANAGQVCTIFARWVNRAGSAGNNFALTGPWSAPVAQTIIGA